MGPLLQAIARFDISLTPPEPPRPVRGADKTRRDTDKTGFFGTGELGDLVVQGAVTVPAGEVLQYANVTVRSGGALSVAAWDGTSADSYTHIRAHETKAKLGGRHLSVKNKSEPTRPYSISYAVFSCNTKDVFGLKSTATAGTCVSRANMTHYTVGVCIDCPSAC